MNELSDKVDHFKIEIAGLAKCVAQNDNLLKTQDNKIGKIQMQVNSLLNKDAKSTSQNEAVDEKMNDLNKTIAKLQTAINDAEQYGGKI